MVLSLSFVDQKVLEKFVCVSVFMYMNGRGRKSKIKWNGSIDLNIVLFNSFITVKYSIQQALLSIGCE